MKPLAPKVKAYTYPNKTKFWLVSCTLPDGTRHKTKHATELEANQTRATLISTYATSVTLDELEQAKSAILQLKNTKNADAKGKNILDAVKFFCDEFKDTSKVLPIETYVAEFLEIKREQNLRQPTLHELEKFLTRFAEDFKGQNIHDIAKKDVVTTYLTKTHKPNRNRKAVINQFFGYLSQSSLTTRREVKVLDTNPVRLMPHKRRQESDLSKMRIIDSKEAIEVLKKAAHYNAQRMFVWLLFTGMRPIETVKFWRNGGWANINLAAGVIHVNASIAKTRTNRQIKIQPNLRAWLERYKDTNFLTTNWRYKFTWTKSVLPKSKRNVDDVCRHTFISYLCRIETGWAEVEQQAGNSKDIQLKHYLALVHEDPKAFWSITPESIGVFDTTEAEYAHRCYLNRKKAILANRTKIKHKRNGQPLLVAAV